MGSMKGKQEKIGAAFEIIDDAVNHPSHYTEFGREVIDIIRYALGEEGFTAYCIGNEIKYRLRAGLKTKSYDEDMQKALKYREFRKRSKEQGKPD